MSSSSKSGRLGKKLTFKGDPAATPSKSKSSSKKKKRSHSEHEQSDSSTSRDTLPETGWARASHVDHLEGPLVILFPGSSVPSSLYNPTDSPHAIMRPLDEYLHAPPAQDVDLAFDATAYEPTDVHSVFVIHKLVGSSSGDDRWSIKSAEGRYLSAEKSGAVTCGSEAAGPKEEWLPVFSAEEEGGLVAFQSVWGGYLSVKDPLEKRATWVLRCDKQDVGFCEQFCAKVQAEVVHEYRKRMAKNVKRRLNEDGDGEDEDAGAVKEAEVVKKFQSWGGGKLLLPSHAEKKELFKAKKEGKLAETLLDRRSKTKSDRYCK
ncbi:FRG1-like family-domain-containing protein [Catenaria anguillulae PL171]|uniref:FRG1-like family-domain-containing protein n=1 Tax=Catenaria anguillulae PL171 TaxID=765915 RepID=A0A1Y2HX74_9FUNG|nr:FRG1-like family-domain-containing protein [Catenaria anguillulae PL171]